MRELVRDMIDKGVEFNFQTYRIMLKGLLVMVKLWKLCFV